jgi:hypothetical protein
MARTTSVAVLPAGKIAESKFGGRDESKGWSADARDITVEMAAIKDIRPAWANREGELLSICTALSEAILDKNSTGVHNISEALLAKGSLSEAELETLLANIKIEEEAFKHFQQAILRGF